MCKHIPPTHSWTLPVFWHELNFNSYFPLHICQLVSFSTSFSFNHIVVVYELTKFCIELGVRWWCKHATRILAASVIYISPYDGFVICLFTDIKDGYTFSHLQICFAKVFITSNIYNYVIYNDLTLHELTVLEY